MSELSYTSNIHVSNRALDIVGTDIIVTIDDTSKEGLLCNRNINLARKAVLRLHPWNFAAKRVVLSTPATTPLFEWSYSYALPADFIRVKTIENDPDYRVEGLFIFTNESTLNLRYIYDCTTVTGTDPLFLEAWAHYLAWIICYKITSSKEQKDQIWTDFLKVMKQARFVDSTEDPAEEIDSDVWIRSRMGSGSGANCNC